MGIIVSSFIGCGKTYLFNIIKDKAKLYDATLYEGREVNEHYVDYVLEQTDTHDIVFISSNKNIRELFNKRNVDYDVFYPSVERRQEFIENQVVKRSSPNIIRQLDQNFNTWVDEIDNDESPHCYKHKLAEKGHFLGNDGALMNYIHSLTQAQQKENNVQEKQEVKGNNDEVGS